MDETVELIRRAETAREIMAIISRPHHFCAIASARGLVPRRRLGRTRFVLAVRRRYAGSHRVNGWRK